MAGYEWQKIPTEDRITYAQELRQVTDKAINKNKRKINNVADNELLFMKRFIDNDGLMDKARKGKSEYIWSFSNNYNRAELSQIYTRIIKNWENYLDINIAVCNAGFIFDEYVLKLSW